MSLIRWGEEGSNVYLIEVGDGGGPLFHCVGCDCGGAVIEGKLTTVQRVIEHLEHHRDELGHCVPDVVFERIKAEHGL